MYSLNQTIKDSGSFRQWSVVQLDPVNDVYTGKTVAFQAKYSVSNFFNSHIGVFNETSPMKKRRTNINDSYIYEIDVF